MKTDIGNPSLMNILPIHNLMRNSIISLRKVTAVLVALLTSMAAFAQTSDMLQPSPLAQGSWTRITVDREGIYRVTASDVPALSGTSVQQIALYGLEGGALNEYNADTLLSGIRQCAVWVNDANGDGIFNGSDAIVFYGEGGSVCRYNSLTQRLTYNVNSYELHNYYFLTTTHTGAPLRVQQAEATASATLVRTTFPSLAWLNLESVNVHQTGSVWVGDRFSNSNASRRYTLGFPVTPAAGTAVDATLGVAIGNESGASFTLTGNGGSVTASMGAHTPYVSSHGTLTWGGGDSMTLTLSFLPSESASIGYLDYIELNADLPLRYSGKPLIFRGMPAGGSVEYRIAGATTGLRVWDVSDVCNPIEQTLTIGNGQASFVANAQTLRTFIAFDGHYSSVNATAAVSNQDLAGAVPAELVVVCHPDLKAQGERIAALHRTHDSLSALVVTTTQVYNEYSSGRQDPIAIRHFLRSKYEAALADPALPMVRYLLLLGRGSYDNRNILGKSAFSVVMYESRESFESEGGSYSTDDMFGYLEAGETGYVHESLEIGIGRLPAKSVAEATLMADKIEQYLTKSDIADPSGRGDWRNYIALLADDADPSRTGDTSFTSSSEYTANKILERHPHYNIDKIFSDAYVQQSGASGSYYPDVNNAITQRINNGCLIFNYVGHGSPRYIGTERFIDISDISNYHNNGRLPFFMASTCSYSHFDNPDELSGAEALMLSPAAAIAVLSATRPISHSQQFNTDLLLNTLNPSLRLGDALRLSKNALPAPHAFCLLGDPALRLSFADNDAVVTSINRRDVEPGRNDTALVLSQVTVEGEIRDASGQLRSDFDGYIFPVVFDRKMAARTLANDNEGCEVDFTQQKGILYKGRHDVQGGRFSYSFTVPRDVAYNFGQGKLSHYARQADGKADAAGQYSNILFGGFNEEADLDVAHPTVQLFINDSLFLPGGTTGSSPTLLAQFYDEVGINAFGSGIGHDITATIDGNPNNVIILNDFYESSTSDFRNGSLRYTLRNLIPGHHSITVKAWNIYNYSASATIDFCVRTENNGGDSSIIGRFITCPNPASIETRLQIEHNAPDSIAEAVVMIYSAQGQLVRTLRPAIRKGSYVAGPAVWNFCNEAGAKVAPGLYIARVTLVDTAGRQHRATAKIMHRP